MSHQPSSAALPELQLNLFAAELTPGTGAPAALPKRRLHVGNHILEFTLRRSSRRSIGFIIDDDGLRVAAPRWVTVTEIDNAIRDKQHWILTKLAERRERSARTRPAAMQWIDGATLPYLGSPLTLRLRALQDKVIRHDDVTSELIICLPADSTEQQLKDRVQAWLQVEARRLFGERLPLYAARLGASYRSYTLSSATRQWGSCTADGRIRLNWRLIHFSLPLIDYVVAHELAHLREMNHGPQFWATVQSIFPEFESARKMLRQQAPATLPLC
ncbi:SprT family zinc-dependent metalloprotease [Actimicrobium sp. CCC2.4]|uniref:M48 family metallopeptidase n=1 Tax=Actimicrobium sp. CCC2.4 TaxID=3048606 RepID=UPI002AC9B9EE|nr:SprT family zinc-dependent metalloprotease [Actimicrobium sp. CCC2.4]MEB0135795.1 SprT family zinc-dependent metalloprotease [Actimicrobium sp. CCC2.4]WPX33275.1 SprT family zinc-dependent metalloprotease [Actimicrobium sp. CCC2.4]